MELHTHNVNRQLKMFYKISTFLIQFFPKLIQKPQ